MTESKAESCDCGCVKKHPRGGNAGGGAVYGLGLIGAAIWYIQHATTFWIGAVGVGKAIVWPAILIYKALELIK